MRKMRRDPFSTSQRRRRRFSPFMPIGALVTVGLVLVGVGIFIIPRMFSHAAADNMDCTILVPNNPLSAQGLATPYQLSATNPDNGPCNEANTNQSAFVQSVIYDPNTGAFSVYSPLVIDQGTQPAVAPIVPTLPRGAVVGIWFGFNGNNLTQQGATRRTLAQANCVNGSPGSIFGQFSYCNARAFFAAVNRGIAAGKFQIPPLKTATDGQPCPTVRDFSVVDQDQSDNVQTQYLATANGQTAQFSSVNMGQLQGATTLGNPSDNRLLTNFIDPALGCKPWQAPDLANNNTPEPALPLDELQAAASQQAPIALVPLTDPMTLNNNNQSLFKTNLYRRGVDQPPAANTQDASGTTYCQNLVQTGIPRLQLDQQFTANTGSPDAGAANNLFTFLAQRFQASYDILNCQQLLNMPNPVTTQTDGSGVVISATFNTNGNGNGNGNGNSIPTPTPANTTTPATPTPTNTTTTTGASAPNCSVDGQAINSCSGTVTINGQQCTLSFTNNTVDINCPAQQQ
ncbi:MAG TPA: hypothetical protein VEI53_11035 [Ktedonobacteraceae bacterium]|nr:hypothetical protein [Ktedonobacteraceae bacterium]